MKWFKNLLDVAVVKVIFINTARRPTKTAAAFHVLGYRPTHLLHCRLRTALKSCSKVNTWAVPFKSGHLFTLDNFTKGFPAVLTLVHYSPDGTTLVTSMLAKHFLYVLSSSIKQCLHGQLSQPTDLPSEKGISLPLPLSSSSLSPTWCQGSLSFPNSSNYHASACCSKSLSHQETT